MKRTVEQLWFHNSIPFLSRLVGNTTYLGPEIPGWSAFADTEVREIALKVKQGKSSKTLRIPFESVACYVGSPTKAGGVPDSED